MVKRPNPHAVALGRKGGRIGGKATSERKRKAARKNGMKGGRPRHPFIKALMEPDTFNVISQGMTTDPQNTIAAIARESHFDHLGAARNDLVAQAFGFKSFGDIAVQFKALKRERAKFVRKFMS